MGAVLEVKHDGVRVEALIDMWRACARHIIREVGWGEAELHVREEQGGATLFLAAPVDVLMTATEINERAWVAAEAIVALRPNEIVVEELRMDADVERLTHPNLARVYREAMTRGLSIMFDDETLTLGSGAGSRTWPRHNLPAVESVPWGELRDVPIALVTGSNGKTTTTRLVAAMSRAAGRATGWSCSDGVWVDDEQLESGDFSGPAGARVVLHNGLVESAVLETARGGILRRGLAVQRADAAIITNISDDHFGEYGVGTLHDLTEVKGVVIRALGADGCVVLNADDPLLVDLAARVAVRVAWFSAKPEHLALDAHVSAGGDAATVRDGRMMLHLSGVCHDLGAVDAMPVTLHGTAMHNIENALGAAVLASGIDIPVEAIRDTLAAFGQLPQDNPGRLQVYRFEGVTVLVDYAHNPNGLAALCVAANAIPAKRRLLLLGQAGNRNDEELRGLARAAWSVTTFDKVIIKEMQTMLRGRAVGDTPRVLIDELSRLGVPSDRVEVAPSEFDALRRAFEWALDGDLLVCPIHVEKAIVLPWLAQLVASRWTAGAPLP
jgi:cyanophycin synthetase